MQSRTEAGGVGPTISLFMWVYALPRDDPDPDPDPACAREHGNLVTILMYILANYSFKKMIR